MRDFANIVPHRTRPMSSPHTDAPALRSNLRLWPGVALVTILLVLRFAIPAFDPGFTGPGMLSSLALTLLTFIWWLGFSRARRTKRWGAMLVILLGIFASYLTVHPSIGTGMMGIAVVMYSAPLLCLVLVLWAWMARRPANGNRFGILMVGCALVTVGLNLLRSDGMRGEDGSDLAWRWQQTPEELLLARGEQELATLPEVPAGELQVTEWSGFRGPNRDSILHGSQIQRDWASSPPQELWRRPVGPAWSSFAVRGDLFFTQEQRGEEEVVGCYRVSTGEPIWRHRDEIRFWESNAGAGPRATPTLHGEILLTLGATGHLNALKVSDGTPIWSKNAASDAQVEVPEWGFSSSPLVVGDLVIVAMPSTLLAYAIADGELRWSSAPGEQSYGSAHLLTLAGVPQVVLLREPGAVSVAPEDGTILWEYPLEGVPCVQPALCPNGDVLLGGGQGRAMSRVSVKQKESGWAVEEVWQSRRMKPYFNDYVVHEDYIYGFDGSILACIDLETGSRQWKGGRYGYGQFLLLADQDLLVVLTEQGELALVEAKPEAFTELARVPAIEGKTWNLPVLVDDVLLVRNDQEMAAFRLSTIGE